MEYGTIKIRAQTKEQLDSLRHDGQSRCGVIQELIDYFLECEGQGNTDAEQGELELCPLKS